MAKKVIVYTGISAPEDIETNGWAAVLTCDEHAKEVHGFSARENDRRMELRAMIGAVEAMKAPADIVIKTNSGYMAANYPRVKNWRKNGWHTTNGAEVKEADLWKQLCKATTLHKVKLTVEQVSQDENARSRNIAKAAAYSSLFE